MKTREQTQLLLPCFLFHVLYNTFIHTLQYYFKKVEYIYPVIPA